MNLYNENGYVNFRGIRELKYPFTFLLGGRGTGKTFGALESSIEDGLKFIYMRRHKTQLELVNQPEFSPIRPVCRERGWNYTMRPVARGLSGFVPYTVDETGKEIITGPPAGYTAALSTIGHIRGFDSSDVKLLIYDEAIPEFGDRELPHEADKLDNCYETINRNRELKGEPPLQLVVMANPNTQGSGILEAWGLMNRVTRMKERGQAIYTDDKHGICLIRLKDSPISKAKENTALYKMRAGSKYVKMAIENEFSYDDQRHIVSRPLGEYRPLAAYESYCIYQHKSRQLYYLSQHRAGSPRIYPEGALGLEQLRHDFSYLWAAYMDDRVEFETFGVKWWFTNALY